METKPSNAPAKTGPAPIENIINPRWRKLLKHAHFRTPADLPASARRRLARKSSSSAATAMEQGSKEFGERWKESTPQGREIIRKKLWEIKRNMSAAELENQFEILRRLVPGHLTLVAARKGSAATWNTWCNAAVEELIRAGQAKAYLEAEQELSALYAQNPWRHPATEQAIEAGCWQALAVEVKKRLTAPLRQRLAWLAPDGAEQET